MRTISGSNKLLLAAGLYIAEKLLLSKERPLGCVHTNRVESSPIQSSQTLESRGVHTDRVESNRVYVSPSGFLVLFEQRASKELYSDGEHACFARDYMEKEVAS